MTAHTPSHEYALAEAISQRCEGAHPYKGGWRARCPAHNGHSTTSLAITPAPGRVLLHCHGGCAVDAVLEALSLTASALFLQPGANGQGKIVAVFDYYDAEGTLRFQVVRKKPKAFFQRRPDPACPGRWLPNLQGVEPLLYRLPDLVVAIAAGQTIYVPEGEKHVDRLWALGLAATCNPMGAGKWRPSYSAALRGVTVIVLPDNDSPGRAHAKQIATALHGIAARIKVVALPGLLDKGDVLDWFAAGGTREQLEALVEGTPLWQPACPPAFAVSQDLAELEANLQALKPSITRLLEPDAIAALAALFGKRVHWAAIEQYLRDTKVAPENTRALRKAVAEYLEGRTLHIVDHVEYADQLQRNKPAPLQYQHPTILPLTGVTVLGGRPKLGKSYLILNLAIAVATGGQFASCFPMAHPGAVLYLALEDNRNRIYSRMEALYGPQDTWPPTLGFVYASPRMEEGRLCRELAEWMASVQTPRLIIIDIFARVKPRIRPQADIYQADYDAVTELSTLAMAHGINIAIVTHLNKNYNDVESIADAIMGSTGITGGTSTVWAMSRVGADGIDAALYVTGKDVPEWTLALQRLELAGHIDWKALGDMDMVGQSEMRMEVLRALWEWEGHRPKASELREVLGKTRQPFNRLLDRLKRDGLVQQEKQRLSLTRQGVETIQAWIRMQDAEGAKDAKDAKSAQGAFSP